MLLHFWGVRGSHPVPGKRATRYGGHTACVEVRTQDGECLIVDAGTGLRGLGQKLVRELGRASGTHRILLSHVHWDHLQGLPFFEPLYGKDSDISVYAQSTANQELANVVGGITRSEFFPVPLSSAPARLSFTVVEARRPFSVGPFEVFPFTLNHPFGSMGYRIAADRSSVAYVSDTAPFTDMLHKRHFTNALESPSEQDRAILTEMRRNVVAALLGVDTVIYDTQFSPDEYQRFPYYGHSTPEHAIEICREAGARRLVLYHHAPGHDDDAMDRIASHYAARGRELGIEVVTSRQGLSLRSTGDVS